MTPVYLPATGGVCACPLPTPVQLSRHSGSTSALPDSCEGVPVLKREPPSGVTFTLPGGSVVKTISSVDIYIIYSIGATIIMQTGLLIYGHKLLPVQLQEKVEVTISVFSFVFSWVFFALFINLWSALKRESWFEAVPFNYFYNLFRNPPAILPDLDLAHVLVFLGFGVAFAFINTIITSYLGRMLRHGKIRRIR